MALLEIDRLDVRFPGAAGELHAVDQLSFAVKEGETVALVGESGSGKSLTALSVLRLLEQPPALLSGRIAFKGRALLDLTEGEMRRIRGNEISMVFQEPMSALNPVMTIGAQVAEAVRLHQHASAREARGRALAMLRQVGIAVPEQRIGAYPHQLSGGMRQRVMIAMALACDPDLLIADEPTTALDVTVQAQILDLMKTLVARRGTAILLITHDLGVVREIADRVVILYAGRKVEEGSTRQIFTQARHPYTRGLLGAVPRLGCSQGTAGKVRLAEIPGLVPKIRGSMAGCAFAPRCAHVTALCHQAPPPLHPAAPGQWVACHYAGPAAS